MNSVGRLCAWRQSKGLSAFLGSLVDRHDGADPSFQPQARRLRFVVAEHPRLQDHVRLSVQAADDRDGLFEDASLDVPPPLRRTLKKKATPAAWRPSIHFASKCLAPLTDVAVQGVWNTAESHG